MKLMIAVLLVFVPALAQCAVLEKGEVEIVTPLKFVRLSVSAICRGPQHEDDNDHVWFSKESLAEVESYRGYSGRLVDRTCGQRGSGKELSRTDYETVEYIVYNFGEADRMFNDQIREKMAFN